MIFNPFRDWVCKFTWKIFTKGLSRIEKPPLKALGEAVAALALAHSDNKQEGTI